MSEFVHIVDIVQLSESGCLIIKTVFTKPSINYNVAVLKYTSDPVISIQKSESIILQLNLLKFHLL